MRSKKRTEQLKERKKLKKGYRDLERIIMSELQVVTTEPLKKKVKNDESI